MNFGLIIGIAIVFGVVVVLVIYYFMFKEERAEKKQRKLGQSDEAGKTSMNKSTSKNGYKNQIKPLNIELLLGIEAIKNNVIYEKNGRIDVIFRFSTPEFFALNESDQEMYEDALIRFCIASSYDFKIIEVVNSLNMSFVIQNIRKNIDENIDIYSDKTIIYAKELASHLKSKEFDLEEGSIQKYIVLGAKDKDEDVTMLELKQVTEEILKGFTATKIEIALLETEEILELFNMLLNHQSRINTHDLVEEGIFESYSIRGNHHER